MNIFSLIPYLNHHSGLGFGLSLSRDLSADLTRRSYPFVILDDTDPLTRIMEAAIVSDSGMIVKRVFLLFQKDHYSLPEESLSPFANPDVEETWRKMLSFHQSAKNKTGVLTLAGQFDDNTGNPIPFAPLFYCTARQVFFHPPCPQCGQPLTLCTDDAALIREGLAPYSRSLNRYLSCGSRTCKNSSSFYACERHPSDPLYLKDCAALIEEIFAMPDSFNESSCFSCSHCPEKQTCFEAGRTEATRRRIVPISFYPFHMLIFEAMSLNALDFSSLFSGAPPEEIAHRLKDDRRHGRAEMVDAFCSGGKKRFLFEKTLTERGDR